MPGACLLNVCTGVPWFFRSYCCGHYCSDGQNETFQSRPRRQTTKHRPDSATLAIHYNTEHSRAELGLCQCHQSQARAAGYKTPRCPKLQLAISTKPECAHVMETEMKIQQRSNRANFLPGDLFLLWLQSSAYPYIYCQVSPVSDYFTFQLQIQLIDLPLSRVCRKRTTSRCLCRLTAVMAWSNSRAPEHIPH